MYHKGNTTVFSCARVNSPYSQIEFYANYASPEVGKSDGYPSRSTAVPGYVERTLAVVKRRSAAGPLPWGRQQGLDVEGSSAIGHRVATHPFVIEQANDADFWGKGAIMFATSSLGDPKVYFLWVPLVSNEMLSTLSRGENI